MRPPILPPPNYPPARLPMFARMPPAVFPAIMGLFGLGLALRVAAPAAPYADVLLGGVSLLWAFAAVGYGVKLIRRPGVLAEDLRVLPGRAGLAAGSLGVLLMAAVVLPFAPGLAFLTMVCGLVLHAALAGMILRAVLTGPAEGRGVTPVWHLSFVGFIIAGLTAAPLGATGLAQGIVFATVPIAAGVWAASLWQLATRVPPAPLRPLLAIHLAPASLFGLVFDSLGQPAVAVAFAGLGGLILVALLAAVRWMTVAGFTPLWAAFTFPLAAWSALALRIGWTVPGTFALLVALAIVPPIALRVLRMWAQGALAQKTNAATA